MFCETTTGTFCKFEKFKCWFQCGGRLPWGSSKFVSVIMDMVNKFKVDADKSALTKFTLLRRAEVPESDSSPVLANRGSMWHVVRCQLYFVGLEPAQILPNSYKIRPIEANFVRFRSNSANSCNIPLTSHQSFANLLTFRLHLRTLGQDSEKIATSK